MAKWARVSLCALPLREKHASLLAAVHRLPTLSTPACSTSKSPTAYAHPTPAAEPTTPASADALPPRLDRREVHFESERSRNAPVGRHNYCCPILS